MLSHFFIVSETSCDYKTIMCVFLSDPESHFQGRADSEHAFRQKASFKQTGVLLGLLLPHVHSLCSPTQLY